MGRVEEAKRKGIQITDLSIGRPDFDTPGHIKEAAAKAWRRMGSLHRQPRHPGASRGHLPTFSGRPAAED